VQLYGHIIGIYRRNRETEGRKVGRGRREKGGEKGGGRKCKEAKVYRW